MIPRKYNPCKTESAGNAFLDAIFKIYEVLNTGASECSCCSFFRGAAIFFIIGLVIGVSI